MRFGWVLVVVLFGWGGGVGAQVVGAPSFVILKVQDVTGAVVPEAEVRVKPVGKDGESVLRSDGHGLVYFVASQGRFEASASSPGFQVKHENFEAMGRPGQVVPLTLQIGTGGPILVQEEPMTAIQSAPLAAQVGAEETILLTRPIPVGLAPGMQVKLLKNTKDEAVYAVVFQRGDEALSGLTDVAINYGVGDAHFTGIGAVSGATVGWLDLQRKLYHAIPAREQVEVLLLIGDVATFNGKPIVHGHLVLGRRDGSTVGGHMWELKVNPTLEVFVTVNKTVLKKKLDESSGMKVIDPTQ